MRRRLKSYARGAGGGCGICRVCRRQDAERSKGKKKRIDEASGTCQKWAAAVNAGNSLAPESVHRIPGRAWDQHDQGGTGDKEKRPTD